ncbi:hypothetical protein LEMA_P035500.1 [Plenodomus lingam JN3]|uniref:WSC domain-containing protein n=1 Tax=Leptosphaeria maculans (strain JN3 / isolate v23.1.3 / race Av1-4-5-6-7-8) TaxID=985895 RepID=E4ZRM9_LEPMJ|nr:hypothetical protein LEMA_P035500.1 [Plenodomus lingam JN3]CBX93876.1 hypothetical protein LEMA_P035500.1 [Plenodomus lingam JN3]
MKQDGDTKDVTRMGFHFLFRSIPTQSHATELCQVVDGTGKLMHKSSDKQYTGSPGINEPAVRGVSSWPRTLNGLFFRNSTNTGRACRNFCASNQFTVAATNNDQCWCDNAIAKNGTSIIAPSYGIRDLDDRNCQQPCPGNATEACGNNTANANLQRLTLYQLVTLSTQIAPNNSKRQ